MGIFGTGVLDHSSLPSVNERLLQWREETSKAAPDTSLPTLGYRGFALLAGRSADAGSTPVVRREDVDPIQLQLINRLIARLVEGEPYRTRDALLRELDLLVSLSDVPHSRRDVYAELIDRLQTARRGRPTPYALLGDPGLGKTFFWKTFVSRNAKKDDLWIYLKTPQSGAAPYGIMADLVEQLLQALASSTETEVPSVLATAARETGSEEAISELLASIIEPSILGLEGRERRNLRKGTDYPRLLTRFVLSLCRRWVGGLVAVTLDDLQWCDEQSLATLLALADRDSPLLLLLLGRSEAGDRLPETFSGTVRSLRALSESESRNLLDTLLVGTHERSLDRESADWILARARGNPLEIVESLRALDQTRALSRTTPPRLDSFDPLGHVLETLAAEDLNLLKSLALLLPPVAPSLLHRLEKEEFPDMGNRLSQLERFGLLERNTEHGGVQFRHDTIERRLRDRALSERERVRRAAKLLLETEAAAEERGRYVLARMVAEQSGESMLPAASAVQLLTEAARRALGLVIPRESLAFTERAIAVGRDELIGSNLLDLHLLAHEAAALDDNVEAMSRHFRWIKNAADPVATNNARALWISRSYAKLWVRGAVRIGWKCLNELDALPGTDLEQSEERERAFSDAAAGLSRKSAKRVFARIQALPPAEDERSKLVARICAMLFVPLLTVDHRAAPLLATIILKEAERHGTAPYTGFGFLFWASFATETGASVRFRHRLGTMATMVHSPDPAHYRIRTYATIFFLHWFENHHVLADRYAALLEQGLRLGSYEWAYHAAHLLGQSLFFRGDHLGTVFAAIADYREQMREHGLVRIYTAAGKFQQAVECLAGYTDDPLVLTGTIMEERGLAESLADSEDYLGAAGLHLLKGVLATYGDRPDLAIHHFREYASTTSLAVTMYPETVATFLFGMMAWRLGMRQEAETSLRKSRRFGSAASGNHRLLALEAERAYSRGRPRRGESLFRKAQSMALQDGFPNEAALIAERLGSLLDAGNGGQQAVLEALYLARGLYEQWGARPAAERVAQKIAELQRLETGSPRLEEDEREHEREGYIDSHLEHADSTPARSAVAGSEVERKLAATRRNALLLFSSLSEALVLTDAHGSVLFHNPAATTYVDMLPDEHVVWSSELSEIVGELLREAMASESELEKELDLLGRTVRVTINPAPTSDGRYLCAVVLRDVTELRTRERDLIVADRMYSLGLLAATVAHEVGNPNHILQLNAEVLRILLQNARQGTTPTLAWLNEAEEAVVNIADGTRRIGQVINQVKEYGRQGREEKFELVEPREIAERVIRFSKLMVERFTHRLHFEADEQLPRIRADKGLLEQAVINLIRNACEALPNKDGRVCLRLYNEPQDGNVCFAVCDQGVGIAEKRPGSGRPEDPEPFNTTRSSEGGSGLGLVIVRSILDRHGGTLRFSSGDEYATIAEMRIPHATEEA